MADLREDLEETIACWHCLLTFPCWGSGYRACVGWALGSWSQCGEPEDIEDAVLLGASRTGGHAEAIDRQYPSQGQTEASEGMRSSDMGEVSCPRAFGQDLEEKGRKQWGGMEAGGGRGYSGTCHHHLTFIL